jgi:hypothetical protein
LKGHAENLDHGFAGCRQDHARQGGPDFADISDEIFRALLPGPASQAKGSRAMTTLEFSAEMMAAIRKELAEQIAAKGQPAPAKPSAHALNVAIGSGSTHHARHG